MKPRSGQGAVEFVLITTVMMLIFAVSMIVAEGRLLDVQEQRFDAAIKNIIDVIEAEVMLAHDAGEGFERTFYVPKTLGGFLYNITLSNNQTPAGKDELKVKVQGKEHVRFLTLDVVGDLQKGDNLVEGGDPVYLTPVGEQVVDGCAPLDTICHKPSNTLVCANASDSTKGHGKHVAEGKDCIYDGPLGSCPCT